MTNTRRFPTLNSPVPAQGGGGGSLAGFGGVRRRERIARMTPTATPTATTPPIAA